MQIMIVALPDAMPSSLMIASDVFRMIRARIGSMQGRRDDVGMATPVRLLSADGRPVRLADGSVRPVDGAIATGETPGAIHIPAFEVEDAHLDAFVAAQASVVTWLAQTHAEGAIISASGAAIHLLAAAGLLGGSPMWAPAELPANFRQRYPRLKGTEHGGILDRGGVLIARGLSAECELMVQLVDRILSPEIAGWLARAIGLRPIGSGQLSDDPLVADAQVWLGLRYADQPRLTDLAEALGVSSQTLLRRFRARLGVTPRSYARRLRITAACLQLEHSMRPVAQIAALVGYDDPKAFREAFHAQTGMSASAYRTSHRR